MLEIGSGTGQHAVFFANHLPYLKWQATELAENLPSLTFRLEMEGPKNVLLAGELDVEQSQWDFNEVNALFTANVFHITPLGVMESCVQGAAKVLAPLGEFCVYGPFRYGGEFTSPSNAEFDAFLKRSNPEWGIRDFQHLNQLAEEHGMKIQADHPMPANNQLLVWQKS